MQSREAVQRDLGLRVRELRRGLGLTQEAAAEKLGMLAPNFARIEQGRVNVTLDTIVRLANVLGVSVRELLRSPRSRADVPPGRPPEKKAAKTAQSRRRPTR